MWKGSSELTINRSHDTIAPSRDLSYFLNDLKLFLASLSTFNQSEFAKFLEGHPRDVLKQIHQLISMIKDAGFRVNGILSALTNDPKNQSEKLYELFFAGCLRDFVDYVSGVCTILLLADKINQELENSNCSDSIKANCKGMIAKIAKRPQELIAAFQSILTKRASQNDNHAVSDKEHWMIAQVIKRMSVVEIIVHSLVKFKENAQQEDDNQVSEFVKEYQYDNARQVARDLLTYLVQFGSEDYHVVHLHSYLFAEFLAVVNREVPFVKEIEVFSSIDEIGPVDEAQQLANFRNQLSITETIQGSLREAQNELIALDSPVLHRMPHLASNRDNIQAQLDLLMERQQQLAAFVISREMRMQTAQQQFHNRPNCLLFYRILNIRLEEYFQGVKVIASGLVSHEIMDAKLVASKSLELAGKVIHGIPVVGTTIALFFEIAGGATEVASHVSMKNRAKHISELGTIGQFIEAAEKTARCMTELLAPMLDGMLSEEDAHEHAGLVKKIMGSVFHATVNAHGKASAQWLAEFCALKVLDALMVVDYSKTKTPITHELELTPQFVRVICKQDYLFQSVHAATKWGLSGHIKRGLLIWNEAHTDIQKIEYSNVLARIPENNLPRLPAPNQPLQIGNDNNRRSSQQLLVLMSPSPSPQPEDPRIEALQETVRKQGEEISNLHATVAALQFQMNELMEERQRLRAGVQDFAESNRMNFN